MTSSSFLDQFLELLGIVLLRGFLAEQVLPFGLDDFQIAGSYGIGQLSRQKEIAGIAVGNLDDLAGASERIDGFAKNDFHNYSVTPFTPWRTEEARCCALS